MASELILKVKQAKAQVNNLKLCLEDVKKYNAIIFVTKDTNIAHVVQNDVDYDINDSAGTNKGKYVEKSKVVKKDAVVVTKNGCECLPTTFDYDNENHWDGCGKENWCDVQPGCENAKEKTVEYDGWDECR